MTAEEFKQMLTGVEIPEEVKAKIEELLVGVSGEIPEETMHTILTLLDLQLELEKEILSTSEGLLQALEEKAREEVAIEENTISELENIEAETERGMNAIEKEMEANEEKLDKVLEEDQPQIQQPVQPHITQPTVGDTPVQQIPVPPTQPVV